jgi:hypothetical protein
MPRVSRHLPALLPLLAALGLACQPAEEPDLEADAAAEADEGAGDPVGAPDEPLPGDLDALLADLDSTATQWQSEPTVAEIVVELEGEGWAGATVTYLAPDSDRFLVLRRTPGGTSQERPTLEGFDLLPVSADGLDAIPGPQGLLNPGELMSAAAEALDGCAVSDPDTVLYSTGAPAAWDGEQWTQPPTWRATISGEAAAVVDPQTGEPAAADPCVAH